MIEKKRKKKGGEADRTDRNSQEPQEMEGKGIRRRVRVRVTVLGEWKEGMG